MMIDIHDMVVRLRDEAARMAPESDSRRLLRDAASTIERLDEEVRRDVAELERLTALVADRPR